MTIYKLNLLFLAFGLISCSTGYNPTGALGGYLDQKSEIQHFQGNAVYYAAFSGNGYTTAEKTEELSLLRCAERAYQDGYNYFIKLNQNSQVDQTGTINTASAVAMPYGGAIAIGQSTPTYAPSGSSSILAFEKTPQRDQLKPNWNVINIESYAQQMKRKHGATIRTDVRALSRPKSFFAKHLDEAAVSLISADLDAVKSASIQIYDSRQETNTNKIPASILVGGAYFAEIPYEAGDKVFLDLIVRKAESLKANIIIIGKTTILQDNDYWRYLHAIEYRFSPKGRVGVTFEPSLIKSDIFKVRTIMRKDSVLQYGDIIQSVDGLDFLTLKGKVPDDDKLLYLIRSKKPGDVVDLGIVRDNQFKTIQISLIQNP